jgi:hypothetical protein
MLMITWLRRSPSSETPLVSGTKNSTKKNDIAENAAKKKKAPYPFVFWTRMGVIRPYECVSVQEVLLMKFQTDIR